MTNKTFFPFLLTLLLCLCSCSTDDDDQDQRPQSPIIGTWLAYEYRKEYDVEFKSMAVFGYKGMSNELVIHPNGTFRCGAYPFQPETSGYYKIDDAIVRFYTDDQMLSPAFRCNFLDIKNDTALVRFLPPSSKDYFYEVRFARQR